MKENEEKKSTIRLPLLALRGITAFPQMLLSFDIERPQSMAALNAAMEGSHRIFLVTQKDIACDIPGKEDLFEFGTVCRIKQQLRQSNGTAARVMVEGISRAKIVHLYSEAAYLYADVESVPDQADPCSADELEARVRLCINLFEEYINKTESGSPDAVLNILSNGDQAYASYFIANSVRLEYQDKQKILEQRILSQRLQDLSAMINRELNILAIEQELSEKTNTQMNKNQRDYYLREEMKLIQKELNDGDEDLDEIETYRSKILNLHIRDKEVEDKLLKEVRNLEKQPFGSAESSVLRNYLDVCLSLPWNVETEENIDLEKARKILDADHFGLEKVKERVLEYLAVKKIAPNYNGNILCLVGPPGTGKTSVAMSIAHATQRKLVRISLGGVHDEAEIRGHRKTYIGAMPGRIINGIIQAKSSNPLFVLDEIDKIGTDYRGDPASALLEVLDGEQNSTFRDNYLEIPWDLSKVFFITTANTTSTIPRALLDRMEVIELSSYTDEEKLQIAKHYLVPKQRKKHNIATRQLRISDAAIRDIISLYTRESGVRVLEREIQNICRKAASYLTTTKEENPAFSVRRSDLNKVLGPAKYLDEEVQKKDIVGLVKGLAWTEVGGTTLDVEVAVMDGTGIIELTGNLGDVMKESAKAAVTCIRSRATELNIDPDFYKTKDIHIHFPEGAIPKDGPSAGITICHALLSALTDVPVHHDVSMTGEITLRGRVMAIGGLKEKTMAALRAGVKTVLIPKDNVKDLEEIDQTVRSKLHFIAVETIDEAFPVSFSGNVFRNPKEAKQPLEIPQGKCSRNLALRQ